MPTLAERMAALEQETAAAPAPKSNLASRMAQLSAPEAPEAEAPDATWQDRVGAALQGMTFGLSDEMGSLVGAAAVKAMGAAGSENEFWDIYDDMMQSEQTKREAYAEAHPGEALALNIAGAVGTGGLTAAKAIPAALKTTLPRRIAAGAAVGAGEGALAGAGAARPGERLRGAGEGAAMGAALGGIMPAAAGAGKGLVRALSKRRVDRPLGRGEDFIPINVADPEGATGSFYRDVIGRAYGGEKVAKQTQKVRHKAEKALEANTRRMNEVAFKSSMPQAADTGKLRDFPVTNPSKAMGKVDRAWRKQGFKEVKAQEFTVDDVEIMDEIMEAIDDPALRDQAGDVLGEIERKLSKHIDREMVPPPKGQAFRSTPLGGVEPVPPTPATYGQISGDQLMEARNSFRRQINTLGDAPEARLKKGAYRKAADAIDKRIREQLAAKDPEMLARFDKELESYGQYTVLQKARAKAGATEGKLIKPKQLLSSAAAGRKDQAAIEKAPLQSLAKDAVEQEAGLKQAVAAAKRAEPPKIGGVQKVVQTAILGAPIAGMTGPLAAKTALPAGYLTAKAMSPQAMQRIVAGQTAPQQKIAEALRRYEGSALQDAAAQLATGVRRGIITEQEQ